MSKTTMQYEIVTRHTDGDDSRGWRADAVGDKNCFRSEQEAIEAIENLRELGGDWAGARYGIREIGNWIVDEVE